MIFTDLTYLQIGGTIAIFMMLFSFGVVIFRFFAAFRNYIYTGTFGDYEKSLMGCLMEYPKMPLKYAFIGYHPGILIMDALIFFLISFVVIPLWGAYIIIGLVLSLAYIMRKRIATKQEFVSRLEGTHEK